jgi:Icc-related predicted phosphoesterase
MIQTLRTMASSQLKSKTVKTRLFLISDTHSAFPTNHISIDKSFRPPFPQADVLIHTGDLTSTGTVTQNKLAIELLSQIPAELKLVIAGNHDLTLHKEYYTAEDSPAKMIDWKSHHKPSAEVVEELWKGEAAKKAGITYLEEGIHAFSLKNGAEFTVYASAWQPECMSFHLLFAIIYTFYVADTEILTIGIVYNWAFNYPHNEDRWNPSSLISKIGFPKDQKLPVVKPTTPSTPIPADAKIDLVMTHGPPWMHRDKCFLQGTRAGCPQLLQALDRVRPRLHCFGHIHEVCCHFSFLYESLKSRYIECSLFKAND